MYYIRYEDRARVTALNGNVDPSTEKNLFWRLPFPDEDNNGPGAYDDHKRGYRLYRMPDDGGYAKDYPADNLSDNPGRIQLIHESGLLLSVACHHGAKLPEGNADFRPAWNGKSHSIELAHIKNTADGVLPVIRCRHCGSMWRCDWEDILPYVSDNKLKQRLEIYAQVTA